MLMHRVDSRGRAQNRRIIKQRPAELKPNRICLHDVEMLEAGLLPFTPFRCVFDAETWTMVVLPSAEGTNHVSRTTRGSLTKPVIDLRNEQVRQFFVEATHYQVTVYEDSVEVSAFKAMASSAEAEEEAPTEAEQIHASTQVQNVTDITHLLRVKHLITASISREELAQAVGAPSVSRNLRVLRRDTERVQAFGRSRPELAPIATEAPLMAQYLRLMQEAMQAVSLFSGAGLLDFAFTLAGFRTVMALELDAQAVETYRANFGSHVIQANIREYDLRRLPKTRLMYGGSPCVGMTNENRTTGGVDNPNNDLVKRFAEAVAENPNCLVAVLENAEQLLTQGDGIHIERIRQELPSDFVITTGVMNAVDYGGYMHRRRAAVIMSRRSVGSIHIPAPTRSPENYRTLRDAFEGLTDETPNQSDVPDWGEDALERFRFIPPRGNWTALPPHLKDEFHPSTHANKYRRLSWDEPSPSLVNIRKTPVAHPERNGGLSTREIACTHGLPHRFKLRGSRTAQQLQLANGVCIHPWYYVAEQVATALKHHAMAEIGFRP